MADELDAPLSRRSAKSASRTAFARARRTPLTVIAVLVGLTAFAIPLIWVLLVDDPDGGRPVVEATVPPPLPATEAPGALTLDVAEEMARNAANPASNTGVAVPTIADEEPVTMIAGLPVGADPLAALPDLVEETSHGAIPRMGPAGQKPADIYARASIGPAAAGGRARIALLVTGLGLAADSTRSAIRDLPGNVTLAFAPYGDLVADLAHEAREAGHEIMLQIPMEPFDYPDNDPGPQTLLTGQPARANLDRLYWLMSRIGAYTGLVNYMGARFTASAVDFGPVMEELGLRGLSYVDDGTSNRSLAPQLARENSVEFARADLIVDREPSRTQILAELEGLEQVAARRGSAIGFASALPITIRTLAEWAAGLESRGVLLVPVSAIAGPAGE